MYVSYDSIEFKEFAQQVSEAIASVVKCDITVVDNVFVRIAGTGQFKGRIGQKLKKNNNFYTAMELNQKCIISSRKISVSNKDYIFIENPTMGDEVSILIPLVVDGRVLAAMGLSALHEDRIPDVIDNYGIYSDFMEKMSEMLSSKLKSLLIAEEVDLLKNNLNVIIESLLDGVICVNMEGEITFINYSAEKLLNMSKSSLMGKNIGELIRLDSLGSVGDLSLEADNIYSHVAGANGSIPVLISMKNIRNDSKHFGKIFFIQEISNIKKKHSVISGSENKFSLNNIVGGSRAIEITKELIATVAKSSSTVLITGESGTGKELCARAIHAESSRCKGPFIPINCSAIPETLLESELLGYEEGAFSGASKNGKKGKFEQANHGTIFLDEIGDMPLGLQAKILRVLQEKCLVRIGGSKVISLDVRIVTATNRDLLSLIRENKFREDLFYRINVIPINMPSLRERKDDIAVLASDFLRKYSLSMGRNISGFGAEAMEAMLKYDWPGNVRELQNAVEYACNVESGGAITVKSLPERIRVWSQVPYGSCGEKLKKISKEELSCGEEQKLRDMLLKYGGSLESKKRIAAELGMGIATLYRKIKKYNI